MAITTNTYTGNGTNKLFSITFPYISTDHIKVYLNNVLQTITTQYTFANITTIEFNTAPSNGATVDIIRETDSDNAVALFFTGSSIRSQDLNENQTQALYLIQENQTAIEDITSIAEDAVDTAQGAVNAVSVVVPYIPVANYAALTALTPVNGNYYELQDSTGATTPTVTGIPVGLVGAAGLTFRLQYNGSSFVFLNYFANDSETRYLKLSGGNLTGNFSVSTDTFVVDSINDRVGIGVDIPEAELDIKSQGTNSIRCASGRHYDNTTAFSHFTWIGGRARGNTGNPSAVLANDSLVSFNGRGYKATDWSTTIGGYYIYAAENWTDSATGTYLTIRGVPTGGTTVGEWARFDQNALLLTNQRDLRFGDSDNSNWVALQAPATVSSNLTWTLPATDSTGTQALVSNGSGTLSWGNTTTLSTAVAVSGTSVDFLSIPSWVNKINVMFDGVSSSGISEWLLQIGDSSGIDTTGYVSSGSSLSDGATATVEASTSGFILTNTSASNKFSGLVFLYRMTGNTWVVSGSIGSEASTDRMLTTAGSKTLTATLDRIRLTTVIGTDTFDEGTLNISYTS
jgi:hypothetical protein